MILRCLVCLVMGHFHSSFPQGSARDGRTLRLRNRQETEESKQEHAARQNDLTTLVIMGFTPKRIPNYDRFLEKYGNMSSVLDRVVVVWNNKDAQPPKAPGNTMVPIQISKEPRNSLSNRFNVLDFIRTSTILTVDDDMEVSEALIRQLLDTHQRHPDQLIGLDGRCYTPEGKYLYRYKPGDDCTPMVITPTLLVDIEYLRAYTHDAVLMDYVDSEMNCEDIAMNFMVQSMVSSWSPVIVRLVGDASRAHLNDDGQISSSKGGNWNFRRSECVRWMMHHFSSSSEPEASIQIAATLRASDVL